jgi:hypothetical protein
MREYRNFFQILRCPKAPRSRLPYINKPVWARRLYLTTLVVCVCALSTNSHAKMVHTFGGMAKKGVVSVELGYSTITRVAYHHPMASKLSMGAMFAFDVDSKSLLFGAPIRFQLRNTKSVSWGLELTFGVGFSFPDNALFLVFPVHVSTHIGYKVNSMLTLGGGASIPLNLMVGNGVAASLPIMLGPAFELEFMKGVSITFDSQFGPKLVLDKLGVQSAIAIQVLVGVAFKLPLNVEAEL